MKIFCTVVFLGGAVSLLTGCYLNEKGDIVRHFIPPDGLYESGIGTVLDLPTNDSPRWWGDFIALGPGTLRMNAEDGRVTVRITECVSVPCENIEAPSPAVLRRLTSVDGMRFTIERKIVIEDANSSVPIDALALRWGVKRPIPTAEELDAEWMDAQ